LTNIGKFYLNNKLWSSFFSAIGEFLIPSQILMPKIETKSSIFSKGNYLPSSFDRRYLQYEKVKKTGRKIPIFGIGLSNENITYWTFFWG
jgi:hypothetical protein